MNETSSRKKSNNDTGMRERVKVFYESRWPFKRIATTDMYKSTQSCISSVTAVINALNLKGKVVTKVFNDPKLEGNPEVVYICTPEFANTTMTPEEWYEERDRKLKEGNEMEKTNATRPNTHWDDILIDFYTSNDEKREVSIPKGRTVKSLVGSVESAIKRMQNDIPNVAVGRSNGSVFLYRRKSESVRVQKAKEPEPLVNQYDSIIADLQRQMEEIDKQSETLRAIMEEAKRNYEDNVDKSVAIMDLINKLTIYKQLVK